jgi:hypothetical protein
MYQFAGKIVTIKTLYDDDVFSIQENDIFIWSEDLIESIIKNFTKADLKDGMVVEYNNGIRKMVLQNGLFDKLYYTPIDLFNDNLEYIDNIKNFTIDKVYTSKAVSLNSYFKDDNLELVWERPVKKMTIAEIEKELGYKIEIIEEDK